MNKNNLVFQNFDTIKVSTKTYTATTNMRLNIENIYHTLPITPYVVVKKKRGRKPKIEVKDPNAGLAEGSIITIKESAIKYRGVLLKKPKLKPKLKNENSQKVRKKENPFRNSITIVMMLDKMINFKISRNGTFHLTGCKNKVHVKKCVEYIWNFLESYKSQDDSKKSYEKEPLFTFITGTTLEMLITPWMRNIDFYLGFVIDRKKLRKYMKTQEDYYCLLETEFGYTGVSIKHKLEENITDMRIMKRTIVNDKDEKNDEKGIEHVRGVGNKVWKEEWQTYNKFLTTLNPKDRKNKLKKERHVTFLVFQSGNCIMSGLKKSYMRKYYHKFVDMIREAYDDIEERLRVDDIEPMKPMHKTVMLSTLSKPQSISDKSIDNITNSISKKLRIAMG